jgi:hypothetical protein
MWWVELMIHGLPLGLTVTLVAPIDTCVQAVPFQW